MASLVSPGKAFTLKGPGRIIKACRELMVIISGRLKTGLHPMLLVALFGSSWTQGSGTNTAL